MNASVPRLAPGDSTGCWIAFAKKKRIAFGTPRDAAVSLKRFHDRHPETPFLVFDATSSHPVEVDLRGSLAAVLRRLPQPTTSPAPDPAIPRGRGRPKLGVVAREITLLPRHWDWLSTQPGGPSVALRKLVEQAARASKEMNRTRDAIEATYRFMQAMAGNEPGFEEACRALFAKDLGSFRQWIESWPADIRGHILELVAGI